MENRAKETETEMKEIKSNADTLAKHI